MKRFIILTAAALVTIFIAITVIAAGEDESPRRSKRTDAGQKRQEGQVQVKEHEQGDEQIGEQQGDDKPEGHKGKGSYLPADANGIGDPNSVRERAKKYPDLMADLDSIEKGMQKEARRWEKGATEDRIEISEVVMKQIMDELMLIRKYAKKEKADKTLAAIDNVLIRREQNLILVRDDAKDERRKKIREERGFMMRGSSRMRGMNVGNQGAGYDYQRSRYRTKQRNIQDPNQQNQQQQPQQPEQP
ncbi:MAG: hypothetical protein E4H40_00545 [Candidatus Brocadiia bacterium]|nr:MAG: hypothetical protein E4H40_00545 [Candidatus Brocadiia bacterium]